MDYEDDGNNDHKDDNNNNNVDNNEDPKSEDNGEDNDYLIFDTTTNLWSDAFLAGREADFNDDDSGNNDGRGEGLILTRTTATTPMAMDSDNFSY